MQNVARIEELLAIISRFDLNTHPFYESWRAGTLPVEKLRDYAAEYGAFVGTIGSGWNTLGLAEYVAEEGEHVQLWDRFASGLGTSAGASRAHTKALAGVASAMFSSKPEAVGALFAFESQQPETAASKLNGLNEHYSMPDEAKEYFVVHARQHSEIDDLKALIGSMSDEEFLRAKSACTLLAAAMWSGLDGVYYSA
jgi:pyrroloquinoline-quinone synthase